MGPSSGFSVARASEQDLPAILDVQRHAFTRVVVEHALDPDVMPPLTEDLAALERLTEAGTLFLKAVTEDGRIVGSVRGTLNSDTVEIGRLVVEDGFTRMGIATALMAGLEEAFPAARRFELFTGAEATVPVRLYEKLGYRIYDRRLVAPGLELVWMEKLRA